MSHRHFTLKDRTNLEFMLAEGYSITKCAEKLNKNRSSIYLELKRNCLSVSELNTNVVKGLGEPVRIPTPSNKYHYLGEVANRKAKIRRARVNHTHLKLTDENTPLAQAIIRLIKKRWSPEQISHRLRLGKVIVNGDRPKLIIAVQTIYDWLYRFHRKLVKYLRRGRNYRHNRQYYINKKAREDRAKQKGIELRPEIVNIRGRIGDYEGDTILGKGNGATGRIGTLVERKMGYLVAWLLPPLTKEQLALPEDEKELLRLTLSMRFADQAVASLKAKVKTEFIHTITLDNGAENSGYEWIERALPDVKVYFAHPYHSWERGCNENANGLLRQYFPKGMDFREITQEMLDKAVDEINNRPRKRLGWKSPNQKMWQNHALLAKKKCCNLR